MSINTYFVDGFGNNVFAKIVAIVPHQQTNHDLRFKDVNTHRRHIEFVWIFTRRFGQAQCFQLLIGLRFFDEVDDAPFFVDLENAQTWRLFSRDGFDGNRHIGTARPVLGDEFTVIHAVEVVAGEDENLLGAARENTPQLAAHRVGRSLIPVRALLRLFGSENLYIAIGKMVKAIGRADVPVQRSRIELRQHKHPVETGVDAVANRYIDEAILAADRHSGFGAVLRQREETRTLAAPENESDDVLHITLC